MTARQVPPAQQAIDTAAAIVTRFAPSPTGALHIGHAWSAIQSHDLARKRGGRFLLRIEDIDGARSRPAHAEAIAEDLDWLGLIPDDAIVRQSERTPLYRAAVARLAADDLAYPCFCTRADIARAIAESASAPHGAEGVPYPGLCRTLGKTERRERIAAGEPHAWRLAKDRAAAHAGPLAWTDMAAGAVTADPVPFGDIVLARKDAPGSYHLCATIDDAAMGVSHVVRGDDLRPATHVHRLLQALLELPTPRYRFHPLLVDIGGARLAKRSGSLSLAMLREAGADPARLADDLRAASFPFGIHPG